jgi:hypothetical protein
MTKLLDQAVEAARNLPPAAQDEIARVMLQLAGADDLPVTLTPDEQAAVGLGLQGCRWARRICDHGAGARGLGQARL